MPSWHWPMRAVARRSCPTCKPTRRKAVGEAGLLALAVLAAKRLYPDRVLELPALVMRDVYGHIKHRKPAYRGVATHVAKRIATLAPNSSDALFSLGIVRRPALS